MQKFYVRFVTSIFLIVTITGCASPSIEPKTREEWQQETKRIYKDLSTEEVLKKAEQLLKLWNDDYTFSYSDYGLIASRTYGLIDHGIDYWRVNVRPIDHNSVEISVNLEVRRPGVIIMGSPPQSGATPQIYRLFWSRMDYLLGKSDKWFSCKEWVTFNDYNSAEWIQLRGPCDYVNPGIEPIFSDSDKSPITEQSN